MDRKQKALALASMLAFILLLAVTVFLWNDRLQKSAELETGQEESENREQPGMEYSGITDFSEEEGQTGKKPEKGSEPGTEKANPGQAQAKGGEGIELSGVTPEIRNSFLEKEGDFLFTAETTLKNKRWGTVERITFEEKFPSLKGEVSYKIILLLSAGSKKEMAATYRGNLGYYLLEDLDQYQERVNEMEKEGAYLEYFQPELSWEEGKPDTAFLPDEEVFLMQVGDYLYRTFGEADISEIHFEYLLTKSDRSVTYRMTFLEDSGEGTPFACTYYPVIQIYSFEIVEVYVK